MSGGLYNLEKKIGNTQLDLTALRPYGDTMNDGKIQLAFTLPVPDDEQGIESAKLLAKRMGINDVTVVLHQSLDEKFTYYIIYGQTIYSVDYTKVKVVKVESNVMEMEEVNEFIRDHFHRKIVVVGASTGTDAHTVGIDAIMNRKGFAGHYGLERYEMVEAYNLGSQIPNEEFLAKAKELKADVLLVSQTVTQKDIHIKNLTELVELIEADGYRDKCILCCGGARITHELAKELGYDAGFGPGSFAEHTISFAVNEMVKRGLK